MLATIRYDPQPGDFNDYVFEVTGIIINNTYKRGNSSLFDRSEEGEPQQEEIIAEVVTLPTPEASAIRNPIVEARTTLENPEEEAEHGSPSPYNMTRNM